MPGCGKTSIWRLLSRKLGMEVIDFDDDVIEVELEKSCSDILCELGEEKFLDMEEKLALNLKLENKILSCSGSVPLRKKAMDYLKTQGHVIYIDIPVETIEKRLKRMKVDRIVWMKNMTLREILEYRKSFYDISYHFKFHNDWLGSKEQTFRNFWKWFSELELGFEETSLWSFIETRWNDKTKKTKVSFSEAILNPSASFGWLYVPEILPYLGTDFLEKHINSSYSELSLDLLKEFNIDIDKKELEDVISLYKKFDNPENPAPVIKIKDDLFSCELYHWPTRAFKDMALQPFGTLLSKLAKKKEEDFLIMIATSWDTGPAALESLSNKENIKAVCLYPNGWTSDVQRLQMVTNSAENVLVLSVDWNFDDTQTALKNLLKDKSFIKKLEEKEVNLSAANSVNFGRIIFQIIFHIHSYLELVRNWEIKIWEEIKSVVPSWNFWNVLWGYYAKKMWLPIKEFLIASNANNVLTDFITTWKYDLRDRDFQKTSAPAMDILISSNIERILFHEFWAKRTKRLLNSLQKNNHYKLTSDELYSIKETFNASFATDKEIKDTIKKYVEEDNYLMDPHTATCIKCYEEDESDLKKVIFSTAEWTKFAPNVLKSINSTEENYTDDFALKEISEKLNKPITPIISDLFEKNIVHTKIIKKEEIEENILEFLGK